jgi:hypothetical protein
MLLKGNSIKPLDSQVSKEPSLLPKLPFSIYLVSPKGGGKSTLLLNMLLNQDMLAKKFNKIFIISPTSFSDEKFHNLHNITVPNYLLLSVLKTKIKNKLLDFEPPVLGGLNPPAEPVQFIENVSLDFIQTLINKQRFVIERYSKEIADNILLIFDDCIADKKFFNSNLVKKMLFNSRHLKISTIITSQAYKELPKSLRLNQSMIILFFIANEAELKLVYEENSSSVNQKDFLRIFRRVTEKAFNFLTINYQNNTEYRLQENFEKFIFNNN